MADPFVGEIRIFCFNFAPIGWAFCDGGVLPVAQNRGLYKVLGNTFGGKAPNTFALPNLMPTPTMPLQVGQVPIGAGNGPNLTPRVIGASGGTSAVQLTANNLQWHMHAIMAYARPAGLGAPTTGTVVAHSQGGNAYAVGSSQNGPAFAADALSPFGGGSSFHNNMMPSVYVNFCIATQGLAPT